MRKEKDNCKPRINPFACIAGKIIVNERNVKNREDYVRNCMGKKLVIDTDVVARVSTKCGYGMLNLHVSTPNGKYRYKGSNQRPNVVEGKDLFG